MLVKFVLLTIVALVTPQVLPGAKVKGLSTAALIALVFALLNLVVGWLLSILITILSLPFVVLTLGLFLLVIPTIVNAVLLKITDAVLDQFELEGWLPAFGMGFFFALAGFVADRLVA